MKEKQSKKILLLDRVEDEGQMEKVASAGGSAIPATRIRHKQAQRPDQIAKNWKLSHFTVLLCLYGQEKN
jgi:hypothetical protein